MKAGTHTIWATTVLKSHAPRDDLIKPFMRTTIDGLDIMGDPSVDRLTVEGPFGATGCRRHGVAPQDLHLQARPRGASEDGVRRARSCPSLARLAYRKPVDAATLDMLMGFYRQRPRGQWQTSSSGIESALQFILASPEFLFRFEPDPAEGHVPRATSLHGL